MANGRSPLPTNHRTPCAMPVMPLPSSTSRHARSQTHQDLLQPHRHTLHHRLSNETLSSAASSNRDLSSRQLSRQASSSAYSSTSQEQFAPPTSEPRQRLLRPHLFKRHTSPSTPPMRDLPPLHTSDAALYGLEPDELDEVTPGGEVMPAGLDLSLGRLYGFPYCMGISNAMEVKAKAVAEAEEAEYQRERSRRRGARLSGRLGSALKGFAVSRSVSRPRSDCR